MNQPKYVLEIYFALLETLNYTKIPVNPVVLKTTRMVIRRGVGTSETNRKILDNS